MSTKGIYENLPLKPLNKDDKENVKVDEVVAQKVTKIDGKAKKRRSTSEIQKTSQQCKNNPKTSKSVTDMCLVNSRQNEMNDNCENMKKLQEMKEENKMLLIESPSPNKQSEFLEEKLNLKQENQQHSTPTSTFDDGYESYNSTPHGSGLQKI